jgi:hypothetical protein
VCVAASALVVESGAKPDNDLPLTLHDPHDPDWIDEDNNEDEFPDTTHEGGECLDKQVLVFCLPKVST